jgi:hypothetical protein
MLHRSDAAGGVGVHRLPLARWRSAGRGPHQAPANCCEMSGEFGRHLFWLKGPRLVGYEMRLVWMAIQARSNLVIALPQTCQRGIVRRMRGEV